MLVDGVAGRSDLVRVLGRHRCDNMIKAGEVVAVFPRVYARPWDVDLPEVRHRAALASVGGYASLSHLTALTLHGLPVPGDPPIHVTAYQPRHPRGVAGELIVHRTLRPLDAVSFDGLVVSRIEPSLAVSWPLLPPGPDRRAPVIEAWRRRQLSTRRLAQAVEDMWWVKGIADFRDVVGLVLGGCESELEFYGYREVFNVPGLDDANRQRVVQAGGRTYRLDLAYDEEMLAVELDGRQYHESPERWAKDIARDLVLAKLGWQTIRLPHSRLRRDVEGCRADVLQVRAARHAHRRRSAS